MSPARLRVSLIGLALVGALASGCLRVQPHQREDLARASMTQENIPLQDELDGHIREYREGSIGGSGVGVGGCGCN